VALGAKNLGDQRPLQSLRGAAGEGAEAGMKLRSMLSTYGGERPNGQDVGFR
jgi:hypothetical protein